QEERDVAGGHVGCSGYGCWQRFSARPSNAARSAATTVAASEALAAEHQESGQDASRAPAPTVSGTARRGRPGRRIRLATARTDEHDRERRRRLGGERSIGWLGRPGRQGRVL